MTAFRQEEKQLNSTKGLRVHENGVYSLRCAQRLRRQCLFVGTRSHYPAIPCLGVVVFVTVEWVLLETHSSPPLFLLRFSEEDAKNLSALCSHISVALENIKRADQQDEVDS